MNVEEIENFLRKKTSAENGYVKIQFKKRDSIYGQFVEGNDYSDLKSKNFWRIVSKTYLTEYQKSKNINLAKIFSGSDFSKLTLAKETEE